jgi:hypothetical protein
MLNGYNRRPVGIENQTTRGHVVRATMAAVMATAAMGVTTAAWAAVEHHEQWTSSDAQHGAVAKRPEAAASNACAPQPASTNSRAVAARPAPAPGAHKGPDDEGALKAGAAMLGLWPKDAENHASHVVTGHVASNARHESLAATHSTKGGPNHAFSYSHHANVWHKPPAVAHATTNTPHHTTAVSRHDNTRRKPVTLAHSTAKMPPHSDASRRASATAAGHPVPRRGLVADTRSMQPKGHPNPQRRELPPLLG